MLKAVKGKCIRGICRIFPAARRFVREQDGAVAVEFGLVMVPFLAVLFAIVETAIVFFAGQTLETAVADSARLIMTGQAQSGNYGATEFKNAVCSKVYGLFDCQNGIYVDVRKYSSFASVSLTRPVDANGNFQNNMAYDPGGPGCITVVRLYYQWPVYLKLSGLNLADLANGKRLLAATAAFRNEPYASGTGSC
jgi:Flp pilus assembly protein TadG